MSAITILLFFVYTYFLGYSVTFFLKNPENFLERNIMRIGTGLGIMPFLLVLMSVLRIPLHWWLILILSAIVPAYGIYVNFFKNEKKQLKFALKIKKSDLYTLVAIALFFFSLWMYTTGAFSYPYLENDDPWSHANGVKYVALEKTVINPNTGTSYLDPYPPGFDGILGILHQTSPSIYWTMKFFNALIISLSVLFFFFFAKEFTGDQKKALFSTFILAAIPCYLSHFIWAHSLIPPLFIIGFYAFERIRTDKFYSIAAGILTASIFLTQPSQPIKFGIMLSLYFIVKLILNRKNWFYIAAGGVGGLLASFIWWASRWKEQFSFGEGAEAIEKATSGASTFSDKISGFLKTLQNAFHPQSGTASRPYTFDDFFVAQHNNMINNPIGIGKGISFLVILGFVFLIVYLVRELLKKKSQMNKIIYYFTFLLVGLSVITLFSVILFKSLLMMVYTIILLSISLFAIKNNVDSGDNKGWILITLLWLLFTFVGVNNLTFDLPVGLFAFRFWMLLALPVALISSIGMWFIFSLCNISNYKKFIKLGVLVSIVLLVFYTSASQKISVNTTSGWPPGAFWTSNEEIAGYVWMRENLPVNSRVFTFVNNAPVVGMDMFACNWCPEVLEYQKNGFNETAEENYNFLKENSYEYLLIDGQTVRKFGLNETNDKINEFVNLGKLRPEFSQPGFLFFKVN